MVKTLKEILEQRRHQDFVGREDQLAFFRTNLGWALEDERRRFVINVSGQGGVGKTYLLHRFQQIAADGGAIAAYTDEIEENIPEVMGRIAEQFEAQKSHLDSFSDHYEVYRKLYQKIAADPEAPQGWPSLVVRSVAKGSIRLARRVPVYGVVAEFLDEEATASLAGEFASYVARKIRDSGERRLVLEPIEVLTPLFLEDLRRVAKKRHVALFFDTYERTGDFLDRWLRDLLEERYGEVPANILLVIAGRHELDRSHWAPYEGLLA